MLNMNSPVVQNIMNSGFNPYINSGYTPQPQTYQPVYYQGYNPYIVNMQQQNEQIEMNYYDPMPQTITNTARNIHSISPIQRGNINPNTVFNSQLFNGYMNPYLIKNQMDAYKIKQREEAIQQGKIWRILLSGEASNDPEFDVDSAVKNIESIYYQEPIKENISIKDKIIMDKNNHFGELEARLEYYRQNNIPIIDARYIQAQRFNSYYNHINDIIGDSDNCDMVDYFTRVYPQLKQEQLDYELERQHKNRKNVYNSTVYNQLLDQYSKSDSYFEKVMQTFSETGVKLTNNDGITITPDEMEIKMPQRLVDANRAKYFEARNKFMNSILAGKGE